MSAIWNSLRLRPTWIPSGTSSCSAASPASGHSDVNNLRRSDVEGDHIEVTTVKKADSISIELNKVTRDILEKYKDTPFKDNKALPN